MTVKQFIKEYQRRQEYGESISDGCQEYFQKITGGDRPLELALSAVKSGLFRVEVPEAISKQMEQA